jgi:hypothetical protein
MWARVLDEEEMLKRQVHYLEVGQSTTCRWATGLKSKRRTVSSNVKFTTMKLLKGLTFHHHGDAVKIWFLNRELV